MSDQKIIPKNGTEWWTDTRMLENDDSYCSTKIVPDASVPCIRSLANRRKDLTNDCIARNP